MKQAFGLRLGLRRIGSPKVPKFQNQAFGLKPDRFSQCVQTPESGLRLVSSAPNPTDYRQTQARREYIRTNIEKTFDFEEVSAYEEFCRAPAASRHLR